MTGARYRQLRVKLLAALVPLIALPIVLSGALLYVQYTGALRQATLASTEQVVRQVAGSLERLVADAERLTLAPVSDAAMLELLRSHSDPERHGNRFLTFDEQRSSGRFLTSAIFEHVPISGYAIFTNDGRLLAAPVSGLLPRTAWSDSANEVWMQRALAADGALITLSAHEVTYYGGPPVTVVSLARLLRDRLTHDPIGYAKIDLTTADLDEYLSAPTFGDLGQIVVRNVAGEVLYPFDSADALSARADQEATRVDAVTRRLELSVTATLSLGALHPDSSQVVAFGALVALAGVGLAWILAVMIVRRLTAPVQHLTEVITAVRGGELERRATVESNDEVGALTAAFNQMMDEMDQLIDQVYRAQIRERDAMISALQSQMNPHFLYNSLETVNMLALTKGQWDISDAVSSLGRQLRYLADIDGYLVPLREEAAFASSWLALQSLRRRTPAILDDRIDPAYDTVLVPRISLQPVVENSLKHNDPGRPITITLSAAIEGGILTLTVADDGVGMPEDAVRELNTRLEVSRRSSSRHDVDHDSADRGYGLENLDHRLSLQFGEGSGLHVCARSKGMAIAMSINIEPVSMVVG